MAITAQVARKYGARIATAAAALATGVSAMAADPATALDGLKTLSTENTGFGPVMWGMAALATGILVGVKWIKRGRGAA